MHSSAVVEAVDAKISPQGVSIGVASFFAIELASDNFNYADI